MESTVAMVGLFRVTEDAIHLGAPPGKSARPAEREAVLQQWAQS
ncbi:hypothetical protein OG735_22555 [Streptomyces sp. NBC_01210]|nr:hypothetical protein OG735_22555 [Streptomyces sp. NBC_01210]